MSVFILYKIYWDTHVVNMKKCCKHPRMSKGRIRREDNLGAESLKVMINKEIVGQIECSAWSRAKVFLGLLQ